MGHPHDPPLPHQCLWQGNWPAPNIWDIVSTPLINSLREAGFGSAFKCYISKDSFSIMGYWFVDNSTIIQVSPSPPTPKNKTIKLDQYSLNLILGSVIATGGQLSASKTKWYLLEFIWDTSGKWRLEDQSTNLKIDSQYGRIPIQWLPYSQASRILEVWITPDVSSKEQTSQLKKITT